MEAEIVRRFLESVGAKADIDLYLRLHRAQRKESFAMLAPNAQIVKSALDPLHFDLRILAGLGLVPVVVLGVLEPKDADAQATRVSEWLVEDDVPCDIVRATAHPAVSAETLAAIRTTVARGAIPLVSLQATAALTTEARFGLLASLAAALDGGIAFNVIPTRATLTFLLRPAPGDSVEELLGEAERRVRAATSPHAIAWSITISSPPLQARDVAGFEPLLGARMADPVDLGYWTEASRFSERGIDAVVFGPGAVAQAHAPDEYVELGELEAARAAFSHVLR